MIRQIKSLPKLGPVDTQIVMRDMYDQEYGIFYHTGQSKARPLSSVAFHEAEQINDDSILEEAMRLYASRNVHEYFKIDFVQFMELPRDIAQLMLKISKEYSDKKMETMKELEEQLAIVTPPTG